MTPPSHPNPIVFRRRLRLELRQLREEADLSQPEVAKAMDWSPSKLVRIEAGTVTISTNDLRVLLGFYGVQDETKLAEFLEFARAARQKSWWSPFNDVIDAELRAFLDYESSANWIRSFQPLIVPGLLQTPAYARDVLQGNPVVDRLVELRAERQKLLKSDHRAKMVYLMDEAVIRRVIGSPAVMREQLAHLLSFIDEPGIKLGVIPFAAGRYALWRIPSVHFEFPDEADGSILYIERVQEGLIVREGQPETAETRGFNTPNTYLQQFWGVEHLAATGAELRAMLESQLSALV